MTIYVTYNIRVQFNPLAHWKFCRKTRFEASGAVFWSLSCYNELQLTTKPFTGRTFGGPDPDAKY